MKELDGLAALVTGAASGIGLATARHLRRGGAWVAALDLQPVPTIEGILPLVADVTDQAAVDDAVATAARQLGGLDVLVNNAGIGAVGTVEDGDEAEWNQVFDVNVLGIVRTSRAALPHLRRSRYPAIVNVASIAATAGLPRRACYSASKGAVLSLTLAMAADLLADGVRVTCVTPGTIDTPWVGRLLAETADPEAERAALAARQPVGRLGSAEEVAAAVAFLAAPAASFVTGIALPVDGGMAGLRVPATTAPSAASSASGPEVAGDGRPA
ncbi:MAG TPA: SDR family oxidoreductase [Actinomycetota bacterium]|nr:SDR family oxidoreductase [Actinomycetota bacterium]